MRIVLTGGGTRGHVYPALAIAEMIRRRQPNTDFLYLGVRGKAEEVLLRDRPDIDFAPITAAPLPAGLFAFRTILFPAQLLLGILQSIVVLVRRRPVLVIGTGGYVAFPVFLAAKLLGIPTLIHEQNVQPGIANRVLGRFASRIGVTFSASLAVFPEDKVRVVGYPVRSMLSLQPRAAAKAALGFSAETPLLFFFGGSQGARSINELVLALLPRLLAETSIGILHGTGTYRSPDYRAYDDTLAGLSQAGLTDAIPGRYLVRAYWDDIETAYSAADLVIGRAGAGTVMETARLGLATVLIPKWAQRGQHQLANAAMLADIGGAVILQEAPIPDDSSGRCRVDPDEAFGVLTSLVTAEDRLAQLRLAAASLDMRNVDHALGDVLHELVPALRPDTPSTDTA